LLGFLNKNDPTSLLSRLVTRIKECIRDERIIMRKLEFVMKVKEFEKRGKLFLAKLGVMMGDYMFLFDHLNYFWYNPKDDDLYMTRIKPVEKQVEVRRAFWRANRCSKLCKGAKYSSNHLVAGFLRSFPQDSCVWQ